MWFRLVLFLPKDFLCHSAGNSALWMTMFLSAHPPPETTVGHRLLDMLVLVCEIPQLREFLNTGMCQSQSHTSKGEEWDPKGQHFKQAPRQSWFSCHFWGRSRGSVIVCSGWQSGWRGCIFFFSSHSPLAESPEPKNEDKNERIKVRMGGSAGGRVQKSRRASQILSVSLFRSKSSKWAQ